MPRLTRKDRNELGELKFRRVVKFLYPAPAHLPPDSPDAQRHFWRGIEPLVGVHAKCVDSGWPDIDKSFKPDASIGEPPRMEVVSTYEVRAIDRLEADELWESDGPAPEDPVTVAWESAWFQLPGRVPSAGCVE